MTGGTVVALGGICETPNSSNCGTVVMSGTSFSSGTYIVKDSSGNTLITFSVSGTYSSGWIASEYIEPSSNSNYTLYKDGSSFYSWTQSSNTVGSSSSQGGFGGGNSNPPGGNNRRW